MSFRLVCKSCGAWEWRKEWDECPHCPVCRRARFAENEKGEPLFVFTKANDPSSWDVKD